MCGIYGAVVLKPGEEWDIAIIRALTWANRERGTDSLGFFDSSGKMTKGADDPMDLLRAPRITKWLDKSQASSWFIAGHTRLATRGKVNRRNAHPFRYGRIIGSHNGMCDAPKKFEVDSEHLICALNKHRGHYQKALQDISGYWGLSWYDGENFYLMLHGGELATVVLDGVLYYSSSWAHLDSCTGGDSTPLKNNQVIRIGSDGVVYNSTEANSPLAPFVSQATGYGYLGSDWWAKGYTPNSRSGSYTYPSTDGSRRETAECQADYTYKYGASEYLEEITTDGTNDVPDWDSEWQKAWAEYSTQSEHTLSDEEYTAREEERYSC